MKCHVCSYYVMCTTVVSFVVEFVVRASGEEHRSQGGDKEVGRALSNSPLIHVFHTVCVLSAHSGTHCLNLSQAGCGRL